jgi:hypothetical protein
MGVLFLPISFFFFFFFFHALQQCSRSSLSRKRRAACPRLSAGAFACPLSYDLQQLAVRLLAAGGLLAPLLQLHHTHV